MTEASVGIIGLGYHVPEHVRLNDDPIFDALKKDKTQEEVLKLFQGFSRRHVLKPGEQLATLIIAAAEKAMIDADVRAADIDLLIGCASLSTYVAPTDLGIVHARLGLPTRAMPLPLGDDFSNFTQSLVIADALIRVGRMRTVLVAVGGDWTRAVDYHQAPSISAADGAGAAVLGLPSEKVRWEIVDQQPLVRSDMFGGMFMGPDCIADASSPVDQRWSGAYFHMTKEGVNDFQAFGAKEAPRAATTLLTRQGVKGSEVTLIGHQASTVLLSTWRDIIRPAALVDTIANFGNMTVASIAVTLAAREVDIATPYIVLLALGLDQHAHAVLLRRVDV
jgi:3-oxoacyl-[acyl-carrier-protein] synthase III